MGEKKTIHVAGSLLVSDLLGALDLETVPEGCRLGVDDRVDFDDLELDTEAVIEALRDDDQMPIGEDLALLLDKRDVADLAEAIRCGERERAELLLDRIFADTSDAPTIREWIDRGRFSKKAREAKAAGRAKPELRSAA